MIEIRDIRPDNKEGGGHRYPWMGLLLVAAG